jgi:hypothetical protein
VWRTGQTQVLDANAIDFATADWGAILLRYQPLLQPAARADLRASAQRAIGALIAHHVASDYTNIALMNAANLMEIGIALNDTNAVATGTERMRNVAQAVASHGIHEFTSPTYTAVQIGVLTDAYAALPAGAQRDLVGNVLTTFWNDLALSTFDARLAGAHSRDYSFVGYPDAIPVFLAEYGLAPVPKRILWNHAADVLFDRASGRGYVVSPQILAQGHQAQRWFTRPWGPQPNQTRSTFIDGNVAIGTSASDYGGGQQKMISADIAGLAGDISMNAVDSGDPYGVLKVVGRDGHAKAHQISLGAAVSQRSGLVTGTTDIDLSKTGGEAVEVSLLIPKTAGITVNGQPFEVSSPVNRTLRDGDVVGISANGASVAFAFHGFRGATPSSIALVADDTGLKLGAVRVTATFAPAQAQAIAGFVLLARNDRTAADQVMKLVAAGHP